MKFVNFALAILALVMAIFVTTNSILNSKNADLQVDVARAQQIAQTAPRNREALIRLASRVNQDASADPKLRDLLQSLQISVNPNPAPAAR